MLSFSFTVHAETLTNDQPSEGWLLLPGNVVKNLSDTRTFNVWIDSSMPGIEPRPTIPWHVVIQEVAPDRTCMLPGRATYHDDDWLVIDGTMVPVSVTCAGVHRIMTLNGYEGIVKIYQDILIRDEITLWSSSFGIHRFENRYCRCDPTMETTDFDGRDIWKWTYFDDMDSDAQTLERFQSNARYALFF